MKRSGKGQLYENRKKEVIKLQNRYNKLLKAKRALPLIPLDKPVAQGWERYFVVREDVRKSTDGPYLERILAKINTLEVCSNKQFLRRNWKTGKMEPIQQEPKKLTEKLFNALDEKEKSFFKRILVREKRWWPSGEGVYPAWVLKHPWVLELKIKRHMLTHKQVSNGEIDSELERISNKLWRDGWAFEYGEHGHNSGVDYGKDRRDLLDAIEKREMNE